ncbi:hypothetical protein BH10PSE12_BH10PSE12_08240 [soil metagenome]
MDPVRIFYSWQSDRDAHVCGRFIALALKVALEALQSNFSAELQLDSDTAGVAGTPPVSETILGKIRACDLFIGDVSFVGATADGKKLLPNPNVMTEFGYARSVLDDQQIILVMNTVFGPERDLPFDLAYLRHPVAYRLEEAAADGARRQARTAFAVKLAPYLEASIKVVLARRAVQVVDKDVLAPAFGLLSELDQITARGDVPAIVPGPRLVLRLAPVAAADEPYLAPAKVKAVRHRFVPAEYELTHDMVDARQWANFDPPRHVADRLNPEARWYSRLVHPGVLETCIMVGTRIDDDRTILVEGRPLEGRIVETAIRLATIAAEIGLDGPMLLSAGLDGLEDVQMSNGRNASRPLRIESLFLGTIALPSSAAVTANALRKLFDALWLGCGFDEGSPTFQTATWEGEVAERLYAPATIGGRVWR